MSPFWAFTVAGAQQTFPEWRASTVLLHGEWIASPIMAVGEVLNAASYGEQNVDSLPAPASPSIRKLYWCVGDFELKALVKGNSSPLPKKYLWGSPFPGCRLWPDDPSLVFSRLKTRVWFLREEGKFLRPTYDGGAHLFIGLFDRWDDSKAEPARRRLGLLLLKPTANSDSLNDFATYLWDVGDIACDLLGKTECVERVSRLAGLGSQPLAESACHFLKGELGVDCASRN